MKRKIVAFGNYYRKFMDSLNDKEKHDGQIIVLFNGFQKKTQKTPTAEIKKALKIKGEYYASKQQPTDGH